MKSKYLFVALLIFTYFQNVYSQDSTDIHYNLGIEYLNKRQYENAILEFSEAIRLDENYAAAIFWRGYAHQNKYPANMAQAIIDFSRSIELGYNLANSYNNRGYAYSYIYYENCDYLKALEDYNKALEIKPENETFIANRANLFFDFKEYNLAIEEYTRLITMDPSNYSHYYWRGLSYYMLEKNSFSFTGIASESELERWNRIINDLETSIELGLIDMSGDVPIILNNYKWKKRISGVALKIQNDKNNATLYEALGDIYFTGFETEIFKPNSSYFKYYDERFKAKERMKYIPAGTAVLESGAAGSGGLGHGRDWVNALENYNKAMALMNLPTAWLSLKIGVVVYNNYEYVSNETSEAREKNRRDRIDQSLPYFIRASQLNSNETLTYHWLAYFYYVKNDYQSAIQAYTNVLRIDPKDALALHNRGVLFHDLKDYDKAIADYTQVLIIAPDSGDTKWYLSVAVRSRDEN